MTDPETHNTLPRLWNGNYCRAMAGNFMLFFSFYLLTPLLPIYLNAQFKADKDMIGLVLSGYVVAALAVRPFSGFIVDLFDRRRVLMLCFFFFFICFTGYIGAGTILMFAIVRTLHGLPFGATTVANSTVAIDSLHLLRRSEGIGYYGLSNNLAMAIAPSAGIWVYSATDNFSLLFWLALGVAFCGLVCAWSIRLPHRPRRTEKVHLSLDHLFLTRAWPLAINSLLFGLPWGIMSNYVAIYGKEELSITDGTGIFFALVSGGLFASRLYGAKGLRKGRMAENAIEGAMLSCAGFLLFALVRQPWAFYLSAPLIGLGNGRMFPGMLNMFISLARPDQRGTANSTILTSWDLGMGIGILTGGFLLEYSGYGAAFIFTAASQTAGTLLLTGYSRRFFVEHRLTQ